MTGQKLLEELQKLTPEQLALNVVTTRTEYASPEDSMGREVMEDVDGVETFKRGGKPYLRITLW
jgi:hypothetical protein